MSPMQTEGEGGASPFRKPQSRPLPIATAARSERAESTGSARHSSSGLGLVGDPVPMPRLGRRMGGGRQLGLWSIGGVGLVVLGAAIVLHGRPSAEERRACELYVNAETENLRRSNLTSAQLLATAEATASELGLTGDRVSAIATSGWCVRSREQAVTAWWQANKADVQARRANEAAEAEQRGRRAQATSRSQVGAEKRTDLEGGTSLAETQKRLDEIHRDSAKAVAESRKRFDQLKRFYGQ